MPKPAQTLHARVLTLALAGISSFSASAAGDAGHDRLRIESDPPGAEVILIGGSAGFTPLTVSERAIYPNDYSDEQASLYGLVTLRRDGCATTMRRVTLEDLAHGMRITLDCDPVIASAQRPFTSPSPTSPSPASPSPASSLPASSPPASSLPASSPPRKRGSSILDSRLRGNDGVRPQERTGRATAADEPSRATADETLPERRLRQLQVLQELLDEGLLSAGEELRIRRSLLAHP